MVEIGSGHSTRFAARAIADGGLETQLIAIDPEPRADLQALKVEWHRETLQQACRIPAAHVIAAFHPGDLLFVDSSHILMPGTDVELILTELLPRLPAGALVQIHDIFLPDAYPADWTWRGYNEQARWRRCWRAAAGTSCSPPVRAAAFRGAPARRPARRLPRRQRPGDQPVAGETINAKAWADEVHGP